ncbi:MAG: hypothetical protein P4M12_07460 [Gammaproteobacteria bacterium]|nr:hypothetical protein [Gammaproteobacteria bacterium]
MNQFIQNNKTTAFIYESAYLNAQQAQKTLNSFRHTLTDNLIFGLATPQVIPNMNYYSFFSETQFTKFKFIGNMITSSQAAGFVKGILESGITSLSLPAENSNNTVVPPLLQSSGVSFIEELDLPHCEINLNPHVNMTSFPKLNSLTVDKSTLEAKDLICLEQATLDSPLKSLSSDSINLSGKISNAYFKMLSATNPAKISLDNALWGKNGIKDLVHYLKTNTPSSLSLSGLSCTDEEWSLLAKAIANSTLKELILDSANIDNDRLAILTQELDNGITRLDKVNLANNYFDDENGSDFLKVIFKYNITEFEFKNNKIGNIFGNTLIALLPGSSVTAIGLSNTLSGDYLKLIIQHSPKTLKKLDFNEIILTDQNSNDASLELVEPLYPVNYLGDDNLSYDQEINLANSQSKTNLTHLGICNGPSGNGMRMFDRVISFTNIENNFCKSSMLLAENANTQISNSVSSASMTGGALALLCFSYLYKSWAKPISHFKNRFFSSAATSKSSADESNIKTNSNKI